MPPATVVALASIRRITALSLACIALSIGPLAAVSLVRMSVTGDLHILRADHVTGLQPWTFFVRFEPREREWIDYTCVGLLALGSLLRSLGLSRRAMANIMVDIERSGRYVLPDVTLTDDQLRALS